MMGMQIYDNKNRNIKKIKLIWDKGQIFIYIIKIKKEKEIAGII